MKLFLRALALTCSLVLCSGLALAQDKDGRLNLNAATQEQLVKVTGMKPDLAKRIIEHRKAKGEFVDIDELLDVKGVDNNLLRKIKQRVYVKPAANCNC
jgi:competence protein ComEA